MNINIRGSRLEVTEAIHNYIEKRLAKLDKYFENPDEFTANVLIKTYGNIEVVEVTIPIKKAILRAEEASDDLYKSIDLVSEKLERQIRKNKTRMNHKRNIETMTMFVDFAVEEEEEDQGKIAKRKVVDSKPMSEEEAILQMDLLGHDFFIFNNIDTGTISVVYRRKDEDYGIIEIK
jgi:ribosomal subunit interface protein